MPASLEEAAEAMSVSVKTIRRWIAAGTLLAYRCGNAIRIKARGSGGGTAAAPVCSVVTRQSVAQTARCHI
ncbi:hypothetical protein NSZ01_29410 [Nocardioides szechwanensis]|uniref:helix-turn-helix domain-containing protein n=1 Tax=Nocardioides szechwanensis TaxID=1005944 RepID=UPI000B892855|nr:hypothetical protein NSZ01_29410 [Nocardioides szechwanensis]